MSSKREVARRALGARGRLVLLRGGLDRRAPSCAGSSSAISSLSTGDADWRSFCERIGWQQPGPVAAADHEQRLAEHIFGLRGVELPEVEPRVVSRAAEAAWLLAERPLAEQPFAERRRGRVPFAASAGMAVAAVLFIVVATIFSWAEERSARTAPRPAREVAPTTSAASASSVDEPEQAPLTDEVVAPLDDPAEPEPSETAPRAIDPEPGSLVADARVRSRLRPRAPARRELRRADSQVADTSGAAVLARPDQQPGLVDSAPPGSSDFSAVSSDAPEAIALAPVSLAATPVMLTQLPPASALPPAGDDRAEQASASWAISARDARWYGVALPPSGEPGRFAAGVGVMAQVDIGQALGRL